MKEYTREQMRDLILREEGRIPKEEILDLLMAFQEAHQSAYNRGYQDGLNEKSPAPTKVTGEIVKRSICG